MREMKVVDYCQKCIHNPTGSRKIKAWEFCRKCLLATFGNEHRVPENFIKRS